MTVSAGVPKKSSTLCTYGSSTSLGMLKISCTESGMRSMTMSPPLPLTSSTKRFSASFSTQTSLPEDSPDALMHGLGRARAALTQGAAWNGGTRSIGDRRRFGVCGVVSTLEVTWSRRRGYHFHLHCLLLMREMLNVFDFFALGLRMFGRWRKSLLSDGLDASPKGFSMLPVADGDDASARVAQYMNKSDAERAARELTLNPDKLGRGESVSFFELLAFLCLRPSMNRFFFPLGPKDEVAWDDDGLSVVNGSTGEVTWSSAMRGVQRYWRVVHDLERVLKGRRAHTFSKRHPTPKGRLDELWNLFLDHVDGAEQSDESIARAGQQVGTLVRTISSSQWYNLYVPNPDRILKELF